MTEEAECRNCGSKYELRSRSETQRDSDSIKCQVCELVLKSWNAAVTWEAKLIERKERHLQSGTDR